MFFIILSLKIQVVKDIGFSTGRNTFQIIIATYRIKKLITRIAVFYNDSFWFYGLGRVLSP